MRRVLRIKIRHRFLRELRREYETSHSNCASLLFIVFYIFREVVSQFLRDAYSRAEINCETFSSSARISEDQW